MKSVWKYGNIIILGVALTLVWAMCTGRWKGTPTPMTKARLTPEGATLKGSVNP